MQSTLSYSEPYDQYSPSAAALTSRRDGGASVASPSSYAQEDSAHKDEVIYRLKQTNASLRMRFKVRSRARENRNCGGIALRSRDWASDIGCSFFFNRIAIKRHSRRS